MKTSIALHRLGTPAPWPDGQQFADLRYLPEMPAEKWASHYLDVTYGDGRSIYRVNFWWCKGTSPDWRMARVELIVDALSYGPLPVSWYVGSPTDWPTGIARFQEIQGEPLRDGGFLNPGVWALTFRRSE